jgi:hypothetical protein
MIIIWKAFCPRCRRFIYSSSNAEAVEEKAIHHVKEDIHSVSIGYQPTEDSPFGDPPTKDDFGVFIPLWEINPEEFGHLLFSSPEFAFYYVSFNNYWEDYYSYNDYWENRLDDLNKRLEDEG